MKTTFLAIAALALVAASAAHAVEATRFEAPTSWSNSRAEVQAEARHALATGRIGHGEAGIRFADPAAERMTAQIPQTTLRVSVDRGHGDRNMAGDFAVGGM